MNRLARWIFETTDNGALAFIILASALIGFGYLMASMSGCSTMSLKTPEGYEAHYARLGKQDISGLRFEKDALGLYRISLDKQSADDSNVLAIIRGLVAP